MVYSDLSMSIRPCLFDSSLAFLLVAQQLRIIKRMEIRIVRAMK